MNLEDIYKKFNSPSLGKFKEILKKQNIKATNTKTKRDWKPNKKALERYD